MVSLKQLTYALAIERHLRFNRAAEECAISQSTLSAALAEMERQLGFQVFERDNKKVLVTALGQQVLDKARLIKEQLDELHGLAQAHKQPLSTPVSIGLIPRLGRFCYRWYCRRCKNITLSSNSTSRRSVRMCWLMLYGPEPWTRPCLHYPIGWMVC